MSWTTCTAPLGCSVGSGQQSSTISRHTTPFRQWEISIRVQLATHISTAACSRPGPTAGAAAALLQWQWQQQEPQWYLSQLVQNFRWGHRGLALVKYCCTCSSSVVVPGFVVNGLFRARICPACP